MIDAREHSVGMGHRVQSAIIYYWPIAVAWLLLAGAYAFLAALHAQVAVAFIVVLFLAAASWCLLLVISVEDWWNDFHDRKRLATVTGALLLVTLVGGVSLGWWLSA